MENSDSMDSDFLNLLFLNLVIEKGMKDNNPSVMAKGLLKTVSHYKKQENSEKKLTNTLQTFNDFDHQYAVNVAQELVVLDSSYSEFVKKLNLPDNNG
ncbi:hypothetical protein QYI97_01695 [Lacticaseibacillus paracasei]|uniref:hypothetical protein n=1 Tax=Lacticaseibacillus paracasei TaxID=1597 RepID=UPI0026286FB1|nr:hypothetical protein [Lacticaseibacillus paracasei]MDN4552951.1 hypothetical protein [Lacticaseibacillus paracasei]